MQSQSAIVTWKNGVPISDTFDDPYYSLDNGVAETRYVFLEGNSLPDRWRDGFSIAELGFGAGLNLAVTAHSWRESGQQGRLRFTTFELYPMAPDTCAEALSAFPELGETTDELVDALRTGATEFVLCDTIKVCLVIGDARDTLPRWNGHADAWFLDGFSPAKNPELWSAELMQDVFDHTAPGGTAATYAAAGFVRQNLQAAGFEVARTKGFGRKRHMTRARKPE